MPSITQASNRSEIDRAAEGTCAGLVTSGGGWVGERVIGLRSWKSLSRLRWNAEALAWHADAISHAVITETAARDSQDGKVQCNPPEPPRHFS